MTYTEKTIRQGGKTFVEFTFANGKVIRLCTDGYRSGADMIKEALRQAAG